MANRAKEVKIVHFRPYLSLNGAIKRGPIATPIRREAEPQSPENSVVPILDIDSMPL